MNHIKSLLIYTISHFFVDLACFYFLTGTFLYSIGFSRLAMGFLLYNTVAFGTQMFIGYVSDKLCIEQAKIAIAGCLIVVAGLTVSFSSWPALFLCAAGNALFHVGGGINSLVIQAAGCHEAEYLYLQELLELYWGALRPGQISHLF